MCTNKDTGQQVPCTRACEVWGVGSPTFSLYDPSNSNGGVNITHTGVGTVANDNFRCPFDPTTGGNRLRTVTISVICNPSAGIPQFQWIREYATCQYEIVVQSKSGCGCEPDCFGKNCGSDGCDGFCGGTGASGMCPSKSVCTTDGICCAPDCNDRMCGDDGCGGSCGACPGGMACNRYQQCVSVDVSPSPAPISLPSTTVTTSTGGDYMASYIGGAVSVGVATIGFSWFRRLRYAMSVSQGAAYGQLSGSSATGSS
jgi:hypothetical protein